MMEEILYTWNILSLTKRDYENKPNGIYQVAWEKIGKTSDGHFGVFRSTSGFQVADESDPDFIPYEELTEDTVISWVRKSMADQMVPPEEAEAKGEERINSYIQAQINESRANFSIIRSGFFPWQFK